jgi:hypothetical protein
MPSSLAVAAVDLPMLQPFKTWWPAPGSLNVGDLVPPSGWALPHDPERDVPVGWVNRRARCRWARPGEAVRPRGVVLLQVKCVMRAFVVLALLVHPAGGRPAAELVVRRRRSLLPAESIHRRNCYVPRD